MPRGRIVAGRARIEALQVLLVELANLTGQAGAADDVAYFLSTPDALKKTPHLILQRASPGEDAVHGFSGATLIFEYRTPLGPSRVFATPDATGRRNVLAERGMRTRTAVEAARTLVDRGAHVVHLAFHEPADEAGTMQVVAGELAGKGHADRRLWALAQREMPLYLPLKSSFEATLAQFGARTRYNLKYYRRRTARDLGCVFVPQVEIGLDEFLALNRQCMYPVPEALAVFRYEARKSVSDPLFCGVQDRTGRWLSMAGGRRRGRELEMDWQINRDGLPLYSLCTVLRSCLIEHESTQGGLHGPTRLYFEGGTPHHIGRSFQRERVVELTVKRQSLYTGFLTRFATQLFPAKNYVSQVLRDPSLDWRPW